MQIKLATSKVRLPTHAREVLKTRVRHRLGNFSRRLQHVRVSLADVNADKGGRDKVCQITARRSDGRLVVVREQNTSLARALFKGLKRLRRLLGERTRRRPRRCPQPIAPLTA